MTSPSTPTPRRQAAAWLAALALALPPAAMAGGKHVHGEMALDVALDGTTLQLELTAPLDTLVGYERRPRNDAERQAAAAAVALLRDPSRWLRTDEAAGCTPGEVTLDAGPLDPAAKTDGRGGHAEVVLSLPVTCRDAAALRGLSLALFEHFPRTRRIEVQVAGGSAGAKQRLTKAAAVVRLRP